MKFAPNFKDFTLSPFTGLTRESWIEAGIYLLKGAFSNISSPDSPMIVPRTETEITYPHLSAPEAQQVRERKAEIFEGLTRTFFIACMLIRNDPDITISGIRLSDYYSRQILRVVTKTDPLYAGSYHEMYALAEDPHNDQTFQQTVETCALVIGLWACHEQIWDRYTEEERGRIASFLSEWAENSTVPQNWRLFNMLDLAFLHMNGYPINRRIMDEHSSAILNYNVGDGWYRDGQSFDYYSCWAFNVYIPLWCLWYGYDNDPGTAALFEESSREFMKTYPDFFDRDGWTNMWGRSLIYRFAAVSPLEADFFLKNPTADPGTARRIASGSLLQFLSRDDFLVNGVPSIGFYGPFPPLVQPYSCAESVYWIGKAFLCLYFPKDHPFWTAVENEGRWEKSRESPKTVSSGLSSTENSVRETVLDGPGLCFTNHSATGETILRTGKVMKDESDIRGLWTYGKLSYSTKYPWEAESGSQQYLLTLPEADTPLLPNALLWCGQRNGVLYRRAFFRFSTKIEMHWMDALDLADFPVPKGLIRADRIRLGHRPCVLSLGSYGFPDNGTDIQEQTGPHGEKAIILRGQDSLGKPRMLAMSILSGFENLETIHLLRTNPDSPKSLLLKASLRYQHHYDASEPHVLISQVLTSEEDSPFTDDELFPAERIEFTDSYHSGVSGTVEIFLRDGSCKVIDYRGIEANLQI